jgi:hypothetical protein
MQSQFFGIEYLGILVVADDDQMKYFRSSVALYHEIMMRCIRNFPIGLICPYVGLNAEPNLILLLFSPKPDMYFSCAWFLSFSLVD